MYTIKGKVKYGNTPRGVAFIAKLQFNNVVIGTICNDGNGGATYSRIDNNDNFKAFHEAIKNSGMREEQICDHLLDMHEGVVDTTLNSISAIGA